ncbi:hypothetical protein JHK84_049837 [Glycine max]|nr:hypothetical protein JHK84_049837 [Glycine max]
MVLDEQQPLRSSSSMGLLSSPLSLLLITLSSAFSFGFMAAPIKDFSQDPSHPLFLHHSDGPGLILTSQPLDHKNYTTWSHAMMVALSVKNKVAFIDGSLPMPTTVDPTYVQWTRGNNLVISWLYNSVSKDIISSILFANTAKEISEDLKTRFSRKNGKCGGLQTLQDYIESEYVMSFLMGLNDSFAQVWGQILLSDPLPPIGNVFSLVIQEEAQREIVVNHIPSLNSNTMAFAVNSTAKNPTNGHTKDKCYKLVGYPPNYFKNKP